MNCMYMDFFLPVSLAAFGLLCIIWFCFLLVFALHSAIFYIAP